MSGNVPRTDPLLDSQAGSQKTGRSLVRKGDRS